MSYYRWTKRMIPDSLRVDECLLCILILHRAILHALEKYSLDCAKDIRDLQETIGQMDERSRRDLEQVHGSLGSIHNGQMDILRSHEDSRARGESEARGNNLSDITF